MKKFSLLMTCVALGFASVHAAGEGWPWIGSQKEKTVTILLLGDINIMQRSNPADAFINVSDTLNSADLVYGNLEGLLVKSKGPDKDIHNKAG